jgi:hypothetical protein
MRKAMSEERVRYGAGGVPYMGPKQEEPKKQESSKEPKKKKKKVIQEIMGDDLNEQRETLDEII